MANVRGTEGIIERKNSRKKIFEDLNPSIGLMDDSNCLSYLLDLPGFKLEDVKLQVDDHVIVINGERQVSENNYIRFRQTFNVPKNSDIKRISKRFEGVVLWVKVPKQEIEEKKVPESVNVPKQVIEEKEEPDSVNVPKQVIEEKEEPESKSGTTNCNEKEEQHHEKPNKDDNSSVMGKFCKNKGIVIMAVLAFSLGLLVSHKRQSRRQ